MTPGTREALGPHPDGLLFGRLGNVSQAFLQVKLEPGLRVPVAELVEVLQKRSRRREDPEGAGHKLGGPDVRSLSRQFQDVHSCTEGLHRYRILIQSGQEVLEGAVGDLPFFALLVVEGEGEPRDPAGGGCLLRPGQ